MQTLRFLSMAAAVVFLASPSASAAITLAENTGGLSSGNNEYTSANTFVAENFALSSNFKILTLSHVAWHRPALPQPLSFDWRVYGDSATGPGALIASANNAAYTTNVVAVSGDGFEITRYSVSVPSLTLGPGNYWLAFNSNGDAGDPHWGAASGGTSFDFRSARSIDNGATWSVQNSNWVFRVEGEAVDSSVPEPATLTIWTLGALGCAAAAYRRRKAA